MSTCKGSDMIVSLLQRLGFGKGQPIQSRAESETGRGALRRSEVKSKPVSKTTKATKAPPKAAAKPAKPVAKPVAKAVKSAKPAKVPVGKVVKAAGKPAAKSAVKAVAKPAKSAKKPVAKPSAKTTAKSVAKPTAKVAAKPAKTVAPKTVAPKSAKPAAKASPPKLPAAKTVGVKSAPVPTPKKVIAPVPNAVAADEVAAKPDPAKSAVAPAKPRVSSRLAQLTVPSMASTPMVASTAAKATFGAATTVVAPLPMPYVPAKKNPKLANNWKTRPVEELSDEEVLAMPDTEYMNDVQLGFFKLKLLRLKRDILASAGETTEHLREETVVVPDPADRATIEEEHALELRTRDRERKLLKKIEQSIASIEAGDYGFCDETGEPIGVGRLLARPTATLSLEAQQRRELKQKMFGD